MAEAVRCFIGLGSNLDNPTDQVMQALKELQDLPGISLMASSSLYRSDPMGPQDQPDYINAVAMLDTQLTPLALLDQLQTLEHAHQRIRLQHWGPRTLDLDLLLYGNQLITCERLTVPHPGLTERNFVLWPLAEIAPDLKFPDGSLIQTYLDQHPLGTLQRLS
ncbi:2-amino-4-hydroxy-6-hydroxymethyldihydropteridine diphosphokinase [Nitrincola sp. MINF-07-Sa-05]|uniref:2-amino-4-hydroxy-6- hydroxymethyldihydropteridine diphosphokinase n=1 Tax=Nitrincola salilacus TaxID=3400273 RepID=UPI00391829FB